MSRIRIGVVGCGAIAQVHHLPNLAELRDGFEVAVVCDRSPALAGYVADAFHIPRFVTDYRELLASDVAAVLLCHTDPKTEVAVAAFEAGKHVFIEKPVCFSLQEAEAILAAARRAGTVGQAGYMKVYDPAFEAARREVEAMDDLRFVQVNHLHPDNALHLKQFRIRRFDDLPAGAGAEARTARDAARREAIGDVPPAVERAFFTLAGSMIHDLYGLREMLGSPSAVVSTEIWNEGRAISTTLAYPNGARCVATWADLPYLWEFTETLELYGDRRRILVSYPTGFARGLLSTLQILGIDADGTAYHTTPALPWESAFQRELRHFHECITLRTPCRTSIFSARDDIALIIDITRAYMQGQRRREPVGQR
jgi:predicted dehydrogenase